MGYLRPTAIVVTATYDDWAVIARSKALEIFGAHKDDLTGFGMDELVSEMVGRTVNSTYSFFVAWDGSKEGWEPSDRGDSAREQFVAWLREQSYGDGSSPLDWVEIQYGGDDREARVLSHADERGAIHAT